MFVTVLVIVVVVSALVLFIFSRGGKDKGQSWVQFFARGKDAGFGFGEIELLRRLAIKSALADPCALFWSQDQLDMCIRNLVRNTRLAGGGSQETQDFLSKLYDYRKKIELERPRIKHGIGGTRQIEEGQGLRILVKDQGVFSSRLIKNTSGHLILARPVGQKIPAGFTWKGRTLSVYFWREDDAGYVFDTEVTDEVFFRGSMSLKTGHGENLFRTQKRCSVRIKTHKAAFLYVLDGEDPSYHIEMDPGLKCFVEDLSDSGCAVLIGGQAVMSMRIKVQFVLNGAVICISGTVRSMEYDQEQNRSLLHIEADPMVVETRNHVLGEVFGMISEEEELPVRVVEEETENAENTKDNGFSEETAPQDAVERAAENGETGASAAAENAL
ncbi:MAG: PilZ domain-containing protein [Treponema sp.]|jgi:c-di-GMP-binding flagellar brake protein YcgR|nr:PilZ domain-containing protein [Treponema sp.]